MELGVRVEERTPVKAVVERRTKETTVRVVVEDGPRRDWRIDTGSQFLNHMIEMLAFYSGLNIDASVEFTGFRLMHTAAEDLGLTMGAALRAIMAERIRESGCRCHGFAQAVLDEAWSQARLSYEGRAYSRIERLGAPMFGWAEDIREEFLKSFIDGLAQGMRSTIHVDLMKGEDPHHIWESAFRALGAALHEILQPDEWRKGSVAGVKGTAE